jgi:3-oxo-5-alpha-steroid 4-dehydrogenase 3
MYRNAVIVSACRGKLTQDAPEQALGPLSDTFVPQKWFAHFYGLGCIVNASFLWCSLDTWVAVTPPTSTVCVLAMGAFQVHLVRRLLETVWMMHYPKGARMHILAYIFGLSYYVVVPLTYFASFSANKVDQLNHSFQMDHPTFILGALIFVTGSIIQWHSHYLLSQLSKGRGGRYVIPRGGLFWSVSCPHYLGEIVIYLGLGILCMSSASYLIVFYPFVWVVVNLLLAAGMTHRWYLAHFKTYASLKRKALIPMVY